MSKPTPVAMWIRWSDGTVSYDEYGDRAVTELRTLSGCKPQWLRVCNSVTKVADRARQSCELFNYIKRLTLSVTLSLPLRGRRCDRVAVTVRKLWLKIFKKDNGNV